MADQKTAAEAASKEPRVARGRALKWSTSAIDALSSIDETRREEARAAWHRHADPAFRSLIDAEVRDT